MKNKRNLSISIIIIVALIAILWAGGIIPKQIGITVAISCGMVVSKRKKK